MLELSRINKMLGAIAGGGLITLLVGLHVISSSVGNTVLALIGGAAAVLGAFLAPENSKGSSTTGLSDDDMGPGTVDDGDVQPE